MDALYEFLADDLERIDAIWHDAFRVEGTLMQEVAEYVSQSRGKMLRPAVVCLSARAHGFDPASGDHHATLGAAIELFHLATLLHDDVIDKAPLRRGRETVNARWGDDVAILFADYLYATSFDLALSTLHPQTLRVLAYTTQRMTEGEFLQVERRGDWLTVDDYMSIVTKKTAVLFSAAASLGALIAEASDEQIKQIGRYGLDFGIAFQITDDTLDYEAQKDRWGKRVGADLAEGKQTLPLLHTLQSANDADRKALMAVLDNGRDFQTVHAFVHKYSAIEHALDVAAEHSRRAVENLDLLPENTEAAVLLRQVASEIVVRQH